MGDSLSQHECDNSMKGPGEDRSQWTECDESDGPDLRKTWRLQIGPFRETPGEEPARSGVPTSASALPRISGYTILASIGRGGMGEVFHARDQRLKRDVALKMLREFVLQRPEHLTRFQVEAEVVARLRHPNIVQVFELGDCGGKPFLVLELLPGGSLAERLSEKAMPVREAAVLTRDLAAAVESMHRLGIIHRDLKPSNVLFAHDGTPKITDFGLAKRLDSNGEETQLGVVLGTPSYMAPEQTTGRPHGSTVASDIHALGLLLYEMLTGRAAFRGESFEETLNQVRSVVPEAPRKQRPEIPVDLETIVTKALAKNPLERFSTAQDMANDLDRFLRGVPVLARRPTRFQLLEHWARANARTLLIGSSFAAVVTTTLTTGLILHNRALEKAASQQRSLMVKVAMSAEELLQRLPPGADWTHRIHERLAAEFDEYLRPVARPDPATLHHTALMHFHLARSHTERAQFTPALREINRSISMLEGLVRLNPGVPRNQWMRFDLYRALAARTEIRRQRGERQASLADAQAALTHIQLLTDADPANLDWRDTLGCQHRHLSRMLADCGQLTKALDHANTSLALAQKVSAAAPHSLLYATHVMQAELTRATLLRSIHGNAAAEQALRRSLALAERLLATEPGDWVLVSSRSLILHALANMHIERREYREARDVLREALSDAESIKSIYGLDTARHWHHAHVIGMHLAQLELTLGNPEQAEAVYRSVITRLETLLARNPDADYVIEGLSFLYEDCPIESLRNPERARLLRAQPASTH